MGRNNKNVVQRILDKGFVVVVPVSTFDTFN